MTPAQWAEVKQRFHDAFERAPEARQSFLELECSDEVVCAEVKRLLAESGQAEEFLREPAAAAMLFCGTELTPGQKLGRYEILSLLGGGGMGAVYRAFDTHLGRNVAIKVLLSECAGDASALKRFRTEAHALSALNHPSICTVHDICQIDGHTFIVMEHVEGTGLDELIRNRNLETRAAVGYAIQIAAGLSKAHAAGIVHRDLKPSNIMVTSDGQIKLLDFGIAKLTKAADEHAQQQAVLTTKGAVFGTPAYMSPEQAEGKVVDARSDLFSFGAVLFEMLARRRAFEGESRIAVLSKILTADPPPLSSIATNAPIALDGLVELCLRKNPGERPQTASNVMTTLQQVHAEMESGIFSRVAPRRRIAARLALVVLVGAAILMSRSWNAPVKRVAVLPFEIVGDDEDVRVLADGLVQTLTSKLSQIEEFQGILQVVPASEIRAMKIDSIEKARRFYGVNLAFTGSGQRWDDRIQFTLNLVDALTLQQIKSKTFEFDASKRTTLREEAVDGAIQLLEVQLPSKAKTTIQAGETKMPAANAEYLKGAGYLARYDLTGNLDKAIQSFKEATRLDPQYSQAFANLGRAHWIKAQTKRNPQEKEYALESLKEAIRLDANSAEGHLVLGEIYSKAGQTKEAIEEAQRVVLISPSDMAAREALAEIYFSTQKYQLAETTLRDAVERRPGDWLAHMYLGYFYFRRNRNDLARAEYEKGLTLTPQNEILLRNLAGLDIQAGNFQKAVDELEGSPEKNVRTYASLGAAYFYQRRYDKAATAVKAGLELGTPRHSAFGNLGIIYQHIPGDEILAQETFREAIEQAENSLKLENSADTRFDLAEYRARLGDKTQTLQQLGMIPAEARKSAAHRLVMIYELMGDRSRALQALKEIKLDSDQLPDMRSEPDLESFWRDPATQRWR